MATFFRDDVSSSIGRRRCNNPLTEEETDETMNNTLQRPTISNSLTNVLQEEEATTTLTLDETEINNREQQQTKIIRIFVALILILCLVYVVVDSFGDRKVEAAILRFLDWVSDHPYQGVMAVVLVYIVATVLFVPGSVLTLGTGYAFGSAFSDNTAYGIFLASMAVFIGASLGSLTTFLLGRYLFRDCVIRLAATYPIFQAVDRALEGNGLKIMILLRLSPLIPYNALDYMSGVTSISFWAYALALVGILPGTIMFCYVGATASSLADSTSAKNKTVQIITMVMGIFFAACGVYVASYYSKRELDRILAEDESNEREAMHFSLSNNAMDNTPSLLLSYVDGIEQQNNVDDEGRRRRSGILA